MKTVYCSRSYFDQSRSATRPQPQAVPFGMALPDFKKPRPQGPKPAKTGLQKVSLWLMAVGSVFTGGRIGGQALVDHKRDQVVALCQQIQQAELGVIHTTPFTFKGNASGRHATMSITLEVDWEAAPPPGNVAAQDVPLSFWLSPQVPFPHNYYLSASSGAPHDWQQSAFYHAMVNRSTTFSRAQLEKIIQEHAPVRNFPELFEDEFPPFYKIDNLFPKEQPFWDELSHLILKGDPKGYPRKESLFDELRRNGFIVHEIRFKQMTYSSLSAEAFYWENNDQHETRDLSLTLRPDTPSIPAEAPDTGKKP